MTLQLRSAVRRQILLAGAIAVVSFATIDPLQAVSIGINLGPAPNITSEVDSAFNALNGISLAGQTLSLNFTFTSDEFVRLFSITDTSFIALLTLHTNASGLAGFLSGTGYLLDQAGNPLQQPQELGSASGDDGSMAAGLFPLLKGELERPLDFFGVHFDLTLPTNPSVSITGGEFTLNSSPGHPFGVGPGVPLDIVPDFGSTFLLLSLGLLGPVLARTARLPRPQRCDFA